MSILWFDVRLAVREALKAPGFSLAAIAALALGVGPTTAIFSIVYATLLAPLPYQDPDQLVMVWSKNPSGVRTPVSPGDFLAWKESARSFQYLEPFSPRAFNLAAPDEPLRVRVRRVTPDGHRMLGEGVALGRDFLPEDSQPGNNRVVLLSSRLWRERYGADPGIVGRDIRMDGRPYTVIGVLPAGTSDRLPADLWMPLTFDPDDAADHASRTLLLKGRLKPGVSIEQAQHEMASLAGELARRVPTSNKGWSVSVEPLQNNFLSAGTRTTLWLLLAAVGFVVAIACVNVANLLLARGTVQERDIAIRASLGASRGRIIRQVITTSLVIAGAGGLLGILSAAWLLEGLLALFPRGTLPAEADPRLSVPVLLFALLTTTACGLLFGSAPAWQASRVDLNEMLRHGGRTSTGSRRRLRQGLVLVELALAVTSLAGAGLAIHSFWNRTQVDLGVQTAHTLTFSLPVTEQQLNTKERIESFYRRLVERLSAVPGVTHASVSTGLPLQGAPFAMQFHVAGTPPCTPSCPDTLARMVTPGFFQTFGGAIVRGRAFTENDRPGGVRVALVSQQFADQYLRDVDPLRQRIELNEPSRGRPKPGPLVDWQIVGVFRTINNSQQIGDVNRPEVMLPFWQSPSPDAAVAVRTAGNPEAVRKDVSAAVRSIDPDLPLVSVRTMTDIVRERFASDRRNVALYGGLAAVALLLAALGVYGVMAFSVAQRTPEIGLRMALGAAQSNVRRQVLREGLTLAAGGLALGVVGAYALGRAMQSTLFGVGTINVPVLLGVGAVLLASALLACYVPARRASAVDPMIALRQE
jgi:putative ABC transport system permease protein